MVVALAALFVALAGSATAAVLVTSADIQNGTIRGIDVRNGTLGASSWPTAACAASTWPTTH
jgi:hypothetical protein